MRIQRFVWGVSLAVSAACAWSQAYPSRQVRIIQPLGVGSPGDLISRAIAQSLSQTLGQAFVVENKVGANGIIGMEACAKAPPDGYTLCIPSFSQVTMNPVLYAKLPYEPLKDLAPVINIGVINSAVVVNASVPVNNLRELMELGKAKPGQLNWGSWGLGSFPHLYATVLQNASGASFTHVPYKSIDQVVTSLLAGDVQVTLNTPGLMQPFVKAGKVKVLAIVGKRRSPLLDAPTLKEAGFDPPILSWVGMTAPAGTPKDIILKINTEVGKLLADPKFVERVLTPVSVDPTGGTPEEFGEFMRIDRDNAAKVARMANLKME